MRGSHAVTMGDRGRLVVPLEVRDRAGWVTGTPLIVVETEGGVLLLTRDQALERVRSQLADHDLVAELLAERRAAAAKDREG